MEYKAMRVEVIVSEPSDLMGTILTLEIHPGQSLGEVLAQRGFDPDCITSDVSLTDPTVVENGMYVRIRVN